MEELKEVFPGVESDNDSDVVLATCEDECVGGTASTANMRATM